MICFCGGLGSQEMNEWFLLKERARWITGTRRTRPSKLTKWCSYELTETEVISTGPFWQYYSFHGTETWWDCSLFLIMSSILWEIIALSSCKMSTFPFVLLVYIPPIYSPSLFFPFFFWGRALLCTPKWPGTHV